MITIDNKTYRNLQEQVQKNKEDIAAFKSVDQILIDFGIKVLGQVESAEQIPEGEYEYGDAYLVGTVDPYDIYIYTRGEIAQFINLGPLAVKGPQGPEGIQGPQGEQGKRGSTIYSNVGAPTDHSFSNLVEGDIYIRTDDASPNNHTAGYIYQYSGDDWHYKTTLRGPQGIQGPVGPHGPRGYTGNVGPQGPAGDPGQSFLIQATLNDPALLPDASQTQRNHAYVVKTNDYNRLYFIEGGNTSDDTLIWNYVDMGNVGSTVTENGQAVQEYNADQAKLRAVQFYNPYSVVKNDILGGYAIEGDGYVETVDAQHSYNLDGFTVVLPLDDTNEITWSADQSRTKLQAHLADAVTNKLDSALVKPTSAPKKTSLVGVDTSNSQTMIPVSTVKTDTNGACVPPASAFTYYFIPSSDDVWLGGGTGELKVKNFNYFVGPDSISFTGRFVFQITSRTDTPTIYVRFNGTYFKKLPVGVDLCYLQAIGTGPDYDCSAPTLVRQAFIQKYNDHTLLIKFNETWSYVPTGSNYYYQVSVPLITLPRN